MEEPASIKSTATPVTVCLVSLDRGARETLMSVSLDHAAVPVFLDVCKVLVLILVCVVRDGRVLTAVVTLVSARSAVTLVSMEERVWIWVDHSIIHVSVLRVMVEIIVRMFHVRRIHVKTEARAALSVASLTVNVQLITQGKRVSW